MTPTLNQRRLLSREMSARPWELAMEAVLKAERKFPGWPNDPIHGAAVVGEKSGELTQAALQFTYEHGRREAMRKEACHVAATAIRFLYWLEATDGEVTK